MNRATILRFCYRVEKEAGLGIDHETKEPCAVYAEAKMPNDRELTPDEYQAAHKDAIGVIAKYLGVDAKHVTPISQEEYDANVDPEEGDEE